MPYNQEKVKLGKQKCTPGDGWERTFPEFHYDFNCTVHYQYDVTMPETEEGLAQL